MRHTLLFLFIFILSFSQVFSQDTTFVQVHFLFGSRPKGKFKQSEEKWFGGKIGGHVGIELEPDQVVNFIPYGKFHWVEKKYDRHSKFTIHSNKAFWEIMGGPSDKVKKASVIIPVSTHQKSILDSLSQAYIKNTPYDYAFIGMRCGSATYDLLAEAGILKKFSHRKTYLKIIYPKKLRKRLYKKAYQYQ
ncbi:MAG: hypothetical protein ACK4ND_02435 [Cytophagaceae bacterium]